MERTLVTENRRSSYRIELSGHEERAHDINLFLPRPGFEPTTSDSVSLSARVLSLDFYFKFKINIDKHHRYRHSFDK